jgi:hypothetical protein
MTDTVLPAELIDRCVTRFAEGLRVADEMTLAHEAERLESLPTSPAVTRMREAVAAEQIARRGPLWPAAWVRDEMADLLADRPTAVAA